MVAGARGRRGGAVAVLIGVAVLLAAAGTVFAQPKGEAEAPGKGAPAADRGIVVVAIDPGSPAEKAGIRRGDVLLKADKVDLDRAADLEGYVARLKQGDSVDIELMRGDVSRSISVELGSRNGRPYLGLTVQGAAPAPGGSGGTPAVPFGRMFPFGATVTVEAVVAEVVEGSPAAAAGIVRGDRIVSVNGAALSAGGSLRAEVDKRKPGDRITLDIRRGTGATKSIEVTLAASPEDASKAYLGVRYQESLSGSLGPGREPFGQTPLDAAGGVVVRQVAAGSPAEQAGIKPGDVITRVGDERVTASRSLADLVASRRPGDSVEVGLSDRDGSKQRSVTVILGPSPQDKDRAYLGVSTGARVFVLPDSPITLPRERSPAAPRVRRNEI